MTNATTIQGFKVYGNYGAMFPVVVGTVVSVDAQGYVKFVTDDGEEDFVHLSTIRTERPKSGSPIGIYFNEMHAY